MDPLDRFDTAENMANDFQSKLKALTDDLSKAEAEKKRLSDQLRFTEQELAVVEGCGNALQEQLLKEVDDSHSRYRALLMQFRNLKDSSLTEETERPGKNATILNKSESSGTYESLIKDLESTISRRETTIETLQCDLHDQRYIINDQRGELRLLDDRIHKELTKIKFLEHQGDQLRLEISQMESKLGHGDYSSASTDVLEMASTLSVDDVSKQIIAAFQGELLKTKAMLQAVVDLKGQSDSIYSIDPHKFEELAQYKEQIATLEEREDRYKAVFMEKISEFREGCCSLFGYKILLDDRQRPDGIPVTHFTLNSIYAETDDENLEFEYESGNTSILVNEYSSQSEISHQIEVFIKNMNSIPAFTANLTLESFNRHSLG